MATTFEEQANEFVESGQSDQDYNADIYAPVKLSNSTRRYASARDAMVGGIAENSVYSRTIQNEQARRMQMDQMEDEAYNRQIEQRSKAAAWNDKVLAQQHGSGLSSMLGDLDPTQPDYLSKLDQALTKYPLAKVDPQIAPLLESRQAVYNVAKEQRDRAEALTQRQTERLENREDNQQFQMDSARIAREENQRYDIEKDVTKYSPEAQVAYRKAVAEGKGVTEAAGIARAEDNKIITRDEYSAASDRVVDINRAIDRARTLLNQKPDVLSSTDPDFMEQFKTQQEELKQELNEYRVERTRLRSEILRPYEDRIAGDKPKADPEPTTAKPGGTMSVKSLLPTK